MENNIEEFLRESNAIEGVYDEDSFNQASYAWDYIMAQPQMTAQVIFDVHKILMLNQPLKLKEIGRFRTQKVWIGGKEAVNHLHISNLIDHWILNVNDVVINGIKESEIFKERVIKGHHVEYERIHPFIDGNGRTGRMFMNWERVMVGLPILVIRTGSEQMEYYKWFK